MRAPARRITVESASCASKAFVAGDPLPHDSKVKRWGFSRFNIPDGTKATEPPASDSAGVAKDTTHMAIVDRDGNVFDATPSGGWIGGAVILGDTGIGMSVRGEQFWLDKTMANQLRPRARPRYTLPADLAGGPLPSHATLTCRRLALRLYTCP